MTRWPIPPPVGRHRSVGRSGPGGTVIAVYLFLLGAVVYEAAIILNLVLPDVPLRALADATLVAALALIGTVAAAWIVSTAFDVSMAGNAVLAVGAIVPPVMAGARPALRHACGLPADGVLLAAGPRTAVAASPKASSEGWLCWVYTGPVYPFGVLALVVVGLALVILWVERA